MVEAALAVPVPVPGAGLPAAALCVVVAGGVVATVAAPEALPVVFVAMVTEAVPVLGACVEGVFGCVVSVGAGVGVVAGAGMDCVVGDATEGLVLLVWAALVLAAVLVGGVLVSSATCRGAVGALPGAACA